MASAAGQQPTVVAGVLDISLDAAQWTPFWSLRRRPVPVATGPALIRTRRPDRREWNVGRPEIFVVITCVLYTDGNRQESDLVVPAADAPLVTGYLNGWPGHGSWAGQRRQADHGADHPDLSSVTVMEWMQDMTARWVRILSAAGGGSTPLDEAVHQISEIGGTPRKTGRFGGLKRNAAAPAEASAVTVLTRQLIAGVLVTDLMIDELCALSGQTREQVLDRLSIGLPRQLPDQQVRALQEELSGSRTLPQDPERASYSGLGGRVEQLLRLAEEQASALIDAARAEAAEITSSTGPRQPCPRCGAR